MAHIMTHGGTAHRVRDDRDERDDRDVRNDDNYRADNSNANHRVIDTDRQYADHARMHFGAALYGWLVSTGIAAILTGILAAAGSAIAVTSTAGANAVNANTTQTVGLVSGILLLIVLAIAYYAGGYVAGRLSRFAGARQGLATWIIGVIITLILGGAGAALGVKYNVLQQLNLPHLPVGANFTTGGLIASILAVLITLAAAMLGGKMGEAYHRKIDADATVGSARIN